MPTTSERSIVPAAVAVIVCALTVFDPSLKAVLSDLAKAKLLAGFDVEGVHSMRTLDYIVTSKQ